MQWVADPNPSRSLANCLPSQTTRQSMNGNDFRPQKHSYPDDVASDLSSVVEESEQIADNKCHRIDRLKHVLSDALRKSQAMSSQIDASSPTQRISQSFYDSLLRKEKSTRQEVLDEPSASQRTYEEGDTGHVDITSSYLTRHEQPDDLADSEPVDFSPVQSQHQLTQFPESQRFKTPATTGKKRTYTGDVIETPAPARNPLARDEIVTNGILGLSQAFAATQAASSPFSNGLPTGPRSDRPSPNVDVQLQPASASSSSPLLRPITELRRAATEPAARYVSMKQSQAERERQEQLQILRGANGTDDLDYDFDAEDSMMVRKRRQRAREEKAKQELKSLSSPLLPPQDYPSTSPLRATHRDLSESHIPDISTASPTATHEMEADDGMLALGSEAETEQEDDNAQINVTRSSQAHKFIEENKENDSVLVPKTGPRHRSCVEQETTQIDASPSLRHSTTTSTMHLNVDMHSSEPFRVMDSQPSQSRSKSVGSGKLTTNTTSSVIDFVEQSSHPSSSKMFESMVPPEKEHGLHMESDAGKRMIQWPEDQVVVNTNGAELSVNTMHRDTIPETNSDIRAGASSKESVINQNGSTNKDSTVVTGNDFETAPTHVDQPTALQSSQISSPIRTTPPGRKRRRLLEISAEPSPRKSQSQLSFNAEAVLQLDEDVDTAELLESSPSRRNSFPTGVTPRQDSVVVEQPDESTPTREMPEPVVGEFIASRLSQKPGNRGTKSTPEMSQEIVGPGRQMRLVRSLEAPAKRTPDSSGLSDIARPSIFDIQQSPEGRSANKLSPKVAPATSNKTKQRKRRANTQNESRMDRRLRIDETRRHASQGNSDHSHKSVGAVSQADIPRDVESHAHSDVRTDEITVPHMVLAHYKGDPRGYYPAKLLGRTSNSGYLIQWDGYEPDEVDIHGVKALDLHVGDAIKILAHGFQKVPYIVRSFKDKVNNVEDVITDIRGYQTLTVSKKQRKGESTHNPRESECEIPVASIYLDVNMWAQMRSRDRELQPLAVSATATGMVTPHDRASTPGTPSSRGRRQILPTLPTSTPIIQGMFTNMAFAISYDDPTQKNMYTNHVQANGGIVIHDSFHDLLEPGRIQLKPSNSSIGFTALLTERHSRKEKYMQALALGLPCLSGRWIEACVKQNKLLGWQSYLLPAGESAELDNATRSRVLLPIDIASCKLSSLLESRPNLLEDTQVIVVTGRGKAETKRAPYLFLIQAIGASYINRVPDVESAKELLISNEGMRYTWVFVDDKDVKLMQDLVEGRNNKTNARTKARNGVESSSQCKVAGNELIVQSLILGRLYGKH